MNFNKIVAALAVQNLAFAATLFLVSGEATPKSMGKQPVILFRLGPTGLLAVRQVTDGADFIHQSIDARVVVVGAHAEDWIPDSISLIKFESPTNPISLSIPQAPKNGSRYVSHILKAPGLETAYAFVGVYRPNTPARITHENLNSYRPGLPHPESFMVYLPSAGADQPTRVEMIPSQWFKYAEMDGDSGLWNTDTDHVSIDSDSGIVKLSGHKVDIDWPAVPKDLRFVKSTRPYLMVGMNQHVAVVSPGWVEETGILVCDSKSKKWRRVGPPTPGRYYFKVKTLGEWVCLSPTVAVPEQEVAAARQLLVERNRQAVERQKTDSKAKADLTDVDVSYRRRVGGTFLYNALTQKMFVLAQDKEDTELLLVEDGFVYFRSKDRLMRSRILVDQLGNPEVLAKDDAMVSVHWAFFSGRTLDQAK